MAQISYFVSGASLLKTKFFTDINLAIEYGKKLKSEYPNKRIRMSITKPFGKYETIKIF